MISRVLFYDYDQDDARSYLRSGPNEDDWCFCYDLETNQFLIWSSSERQILGANHECEANTLEGAMTIVSKWT